MKVNALYIQSGGPTSVINASAYGVIRECMQKEQKIKKLYGVEHGIIGLLNERLIDIYSLDPKDIELLPGTPSMIFGSCRYRIPDHTRNSENYEKICRILKKYNIRYIFYNGGNGTVRACKAMKDYLDSVGYFCQTIVIPKTVDNDISCIDHAPGFPSAARHVVISISELAHDLRTYDTGLITTVEVMGRNTGFLAASCILAGREGNGPDLIYIPEVVFEPAKFVQDVRAVYEKKGKCFVVVAEGVRTKEGKYLFDMPESFKVDNPQLNMGGISNYLHSLLQKHFDCKIRCLDLGLMQRCAVHDASKRDMEEAIEAGREAVRAAVSGKDAVMVSIKRISDRPYQIKFDLVPIEEVVKEDATLPARYLNKEQNNILPEFADYIEPLVGELPVYAKLR